MDDADDARIWLTYADLARRLGVRTESARKTVQRKRWPRKTNNRGETLVGVPLVVLPPEGQSPATVPSDSPETITPDTGPVVLIAIATLAGQIERLEAELIAVKAERDAERLVTGQVNALQASLDAVRGERDRLLTREHLREQRRWWRRLVG